MTRDADVPTASTEWRVSPGLVSYPSAMAQMDERVERVAAGQAPELVWLLQHPSLYTGGTSAVVSELLSPDRFPVYRTGRGGRFTYHGPGQRVVYLVLDLRQRGQDLRRFVWQLEEWLIRSLGRLGVVAGRRQGLIGVWVATAPDIDAKIAAVGVRVRRWISCHGVAINVTTDLRHFEGIVPCGVRDHGVTSLEALGSKLTMADLDAALALEFEPLLAPTVAATAQP
ncbi:MAG: lipoyl(octanoyl) transferase LipB [Rhodospirillales bacterium]|nr:lipoyl(octanoyl) transferase LipB [Rhodospirillales bacterium]